MMAMWKMYWLEKDAGWNSFGVGVGVVGVVVVVVVVVDD